MVVDADEEVLFFPTYGRPDGGGGWHVHVRGWVYDPREDSRSRRLLLGMLSHALGLAPEQLESATFRERAWAFLVDNERGKRLAVRLGGAEFVLEQSGAGGHFEGTIPLGAGVAGWVAFEAVTALDDGRRFAGRARLLDGDGLSVISDIDDTVKVTEVGDRRTVLANTFLREFRAVPGMADVYRRWSEAGAAFHYVSGSPWQLYRPLSAFLSSSGFPDGTYHLKTFRWRDPSAVKHLSQHEEAKRSAITALLEAFPSRRFVLVGDSGEQDPEIYGRLAREYPRQVTRVLIRDVSGSGVAADRFGGLSPGVWSVFHEPGEIDVRSPVLPFRE